MLRRLGMWAANVFPAVLLATMGNNSVRVVSRLRSAARTRLLKGSQVLESISSGWHEKRAATPYHAQIIHDLNTEGVHVTTVERLLAPLEFRHVMARASALIAGNDSIEQSAQWVRGECSKDLTAEALLERLPEIYLFGLNPQILQLVQSYLRLPPAYHGGVLRHSLVDGGLAGPRLWHQDSEDFHVFRMVMYLNDVTEGGGPFEYIPRSLGITYKHITDPRIPLTSERMQAIVPKTSWKRCFGPAGTVVLCDTAKVFHHESMQEKRSRSVVMFGYSSRRPSNLSLAMAHFPVERVSGKLAGIVPPEILPHVFSWR
jgi:hypothetical protein